MGSKEPSKGNPKVPFPRVPSVSTAKRTPPLEVTRRLEIGDCVADVAWSPDGKTLAVASLGGPILLFDGLSGRLRHELAGHPLGTSALAWHPDGRILASVGMDGIVRRWLVWTGDEYCALSVGKEWAGQVAFSDSGTYLAAAAGKRVRCWDMKGTVLHDWEDHPSTVTALRWRPGVDEVATAVYGGLRRWQPHAAARQ